MQEEEWKMSEHHRKHSQKRIFRFEKQQVILDDFDSAGYILDIGGVCRVSSNDLLCLSEGAFPIRKSRPLFRKGRMMSASFFDLFYQITENNMVKGEKNIPVDFSKETSRLVISFHRKIVLALFPINIELQPRPAW